MEIRSLLGENFYITMVKLCDVTSSELLITFQSTNFFVNFDFCYYSRLSLFAVAVFPQTTSNNEIVNNEGVRTILDSI